MRKRSIIYSALWIFGLGAVILAVGYGGNVVIQADVLNIGASATKALTIAIAIGAGMIFVSALMFIWAGTIKNK